MKASQPSYIALFTDFGNASPYVGQLKALLAHSLPQLPVIDLTHVAPRFGPKSSAYLLAALIHHLPPGGLIISVVDPGVGSDRLPLIVHLAGYTFVGPDNGLLSQVAKMQSECRIQVIDPSNYDLSPSFHARDLFVPAAIEFLLGDDVLSHEILITEMVGADWSTELAEFIYFDDFGNAFTGLSSGFLAKDTKIQIGDRYLSYARTFSEVGLGEAFWYENSMGLIEVAVNQAHAADLLGIDVGDQVHYLVA